MLFQHRVIITHRETFTLGFLWYGAMPIAISAAALPLDVPELQYWQKIATLMGPETLRREVIWAFFIWLSFNAGCIAAGQSSADGARAVTAERSDPDIWRVILTSVGLIFIAFGIAWAVSNRAILFSGYGVEYDDEIRGPLQGALVYTGVTTLFAFLMRREIGLSATVVGVLALALLAVLSLSVGTRSMPVLITIAAVGLASRQTGGIGRLKLVTGGIMFIAFFSALAAWRQGSSDIGFALLTPALEPLYTYISTATYLAFNETALFDGPSPLLASFANLVPRVVWPGKVEFLEATTGGAQIFAPLGATHLFASLLLNFGWLGSIIVMFIAGAGVERMSQSRRAPWMAGYAIIVAVMATDIWRNPLSQSLVKSIVQGAIMVPILLITLATVLGQVRKRLGRANLKPG